MHNCYLIILCCIVMIQLYAQSIAYNKCDLVFSLVNQTIINECIDYTNQLDAGLYGYDYIEINEDDLINSVQRCITNNFKDHNVKTYYFFYDARTGQSCRINGNKCNSVQVKLDVGYFQYTISKELRYELKENT